MSWWAYVQRTAQTDRQRDIAEKTGIDASNLTRWKNGAAPGPQFVAQFARSYSRPVLEAFIAAEFLTADEAKARPAREPDYTQLTNDELLELVRARMSEEVTGNAEHPAPNTRRHLAAASGGATPSESEEAAEVGRSARARQEKARAEMKKRSDD